MSSATAAAPRIPREIWVLVSAMFVIALGYGIVAPVLPQFAVSFGVGVTAASVVVSAFALMRFVSAPAGGALISRFGERTMYLAGLLIVALSTGAAAFSQTFTQLLVLRGLGGVGSILFSVSAMGLIVRLAPPVLRGRAASLYGSAFLLGGVGGPVIGSLLAAFGYRAPFLVYAVALLVAAAVVAGFLSGTSLRPAPGAARVAPMRVREALADSAFRSSLAGGFANGWGNFGARMSLIPLFVAAVPTLGAALSGVALTVFAAGNAIALQIAGPAVDARGRKPVVLTGLAVCGAATAALGLSGSAAVLLVLCVVAGLGAGLLTPGLQATVADVVGNDRSGGKVLSAYQMAQDLGAISGPILTGVIVELVGFDWAFGLTGLILLLGAAAWLPARETAASLRR